ncbi:MAG: exodeoxyribonuclease V subunit gamma [Thermomonas sp.]|uniref:exodeoxyribonuclease V subunit gamma n=1 Tax=Thermomonas sp. TaxID=1971895 RepID=UPI00262B325A|nr:exodeoxyribonuclease V subunit gamma [Thermomonas sp.]MCC7097362.1 exodeoxyribonuclease V subunit gamma [Thermomonas sp.]
MIAATDFRLYHSSALDVLAALMAEELRRPVAGRGLLEPDVILIPQPAMRRWLQATLAEKFGVAANLKFLAPGEFVQQALDANLGASNTDLDAEALCWRLHAALGDVELLSRPALASIAAHLRDGDAGKRWALAEELARVYTRYSAWRRDWLLRWDDGADPDDPQAILWRAVTHGRTHRARRIGEYLARFSDGDGRPEGLPARLFVFAALNISPDVLRVLASQARIGTLHFYLPNPTREYWGDLQSRQMQGPDENPLLRDWGAAGRDFVALLEGYEVVHPSLDIKAHPDPAPADPQQPCSLLRQMQSDLLHRRAPPVQAQRAAVDRSDCSLQFHACHTRLRELQVLHDRLRVLLDPTLPEGRSFDPPLQPREIAVLAPDIDLYAPYLDAVFGGAGEHGREGRIPYTLADSSPLQCEPLAEVFLRLLALPVSRFGLEDVLDLLASPALAEAFDVGPEDIERLRSWLHAAGARWGLDAEHRDRSGAPRETAYTWQFALDRLLLGHASDSEALIGGVAPWTDLEGGVLTAMDALLRLLRVLARHEARFRVPMPPAQWRDLLQALLSVLLPRPPRDRAAARSLERLRTLIVEFADQAERAGVDEAVPFELVRTCFTARLNEADTRAPLLTGGVSVARMVPMRLLPFRVVCLLGMNEGEFPRSDPAAGLNRLTAELGTERRRPGDRSIREDDRFLFLQLFAAAQEVLYLSWIGKDPRDGSDREPSTLVTELLAAAAACHMPPVSGESPVAQQLVLQHPLQPFSAAAFGDGKDPRRFSCRDDWRGAALPAALRTPLPAWLPRDVSLPESGEAEQVLSLTALRQFFRAPAEQFLRQRLHLRLPILEDVLDDIEPLQLPDSALEQHGLKSALFDALVAGHAWSDILATLRARGLLPAGPMGEQVLEALRSEIGPYVDVFLNWQGGAVPTDVALDVDIDGLRLQSHLREVYPHGAVRMRFGKPSGNSVLRNGMDWLLLGAAGVDLGLVEIEEREGVGIAAFPRTPCDRERAIDALRLLLALRRDGLRTPLAFAPYSSWALYESRENPARGLKHAARKWNGGSWDKGFAEGSEAGSRLALRGRDWFTQREEAAEFARVAGLVFGALTLAQPEPIVIDGVSLPESDETEGAE